MIIWDQLRQYVGNRRAFIELIVGPSVPDVIKFDENTCAFPLGNMGNRENIGYVRMVLQRLRIKFDSNFLDDAFKQGSEFNSVTAMTYCELPNNEFEMAIAGELPKTAHLRALMALYAGGPFLALMRMQWSEPHGANVVFVAPPYRRGVLPRHGADPIQPSFLNECASLKDDDQFNYLLILLEQATELKDELFRIARLYSVLEMIAGPLISQFERKAGRSMKRHAIRFMRGYFVDMDIPRFSIDTSEFEFDHIELAGQVRDKIFHGGGKLKAEQLNEKLRPGAALLDIRPDLVSHVLRRDCEAELVKWVTHQSSAWRAQSGEYFSLPDRDPNYDGKSLVKLLVSSSAKKGGAIGSVLVQVTGADIGIVKLRIKQ